MKLAADRVVLALEAEHAQESLVAQRGYAFTIDRVESLRGRIEQQAGERLAVPHPNLGALAIADVAIEDRDALRVRIGPDVGPDVVTVGPAVVALDLFRRAVGHHAFIKPTLFGILGARPHLPVRSAEDLVAGSPIDP